jgi:hypothetical protein
MNFGVITHLQNMYINKETTASWNLHLALNLLAVTDKPQELEM